MSRRIITVFACCALPVLSLSTGWAKSPTRNTKLGTGALANKTAGTDNTAIGFDALERDTSGNGNTAVGSGALQNNTAGIANTAVGFNALFSNIDGTLNTAVGPGALGDNTSGLVNTAVGVNALSSNTTGESNVALGIDALDSNIGGSDNTGIGADALNTNATGHHNTAVGSGANVSTDGLSNATAIGAGAVADGSNLVVLGNTSVVLVKTSGDLRVKSCVTSGDGSTAIAGICASDARLKTGIRPFPFVVDRLAKLQPVYFHWKPEEYPELQLGTGESYGLIAQEVEKVMPELVSEDSKGFKAVHYSMLPLMMLQGMKEQQQEIVRQREENAALKTRLERIEQLLRERTAAAEVR